MPENELNPQGTPQPIVKPSAPIAPPVSISPEPYREPLAPEDTPKGRDERIKAQEIRDNLQNLENNLQNLGNSGVMGNIQKIAVPATPIPVTPVVGATKPPFTQKPILFNTFSRDTTEKLGRSFDEQGGKEKKVFSTYPPPRPLEKKPFSSPFPIPLTIPPVRRESAPPLNLPTEKEPAAKGQKTNGKKVGQIVAIIVIVLLLFLAGLYSLGKKVDEQMRQEEAARTQPIPNQALFENNDSQ